MTKDKTSDRQASFPSRGFVFCPTFYESLRFFAYRFVNPFRWKSLYYDTESNLYTTYTASGMKYYDPELRIYLSPRNIETVLASAATVYGLNLYTLTVDNPVNMVYNGDTIDTDTELVYDIPELSGWDQFWRGPWGKVIAVLAIYAAWTLAVFCPAFIPYFISGMAWTAAGLGVSAAIAGYQSWRTGHGFWSGFGQALSNGWSCSFAFGMAISMVTFGISQAVQAIGKAIKARTSLKKLDPNTVRFSQNTVNGVEAQSIIDDMAMNGWKKDSVIDVVRMPDGGLTSLDNKRLLAAKITGTPVKANVHAYNDLMPLLRANQVMRGTATTSTTWGQATLYRIGRQASWFRNEFSFGAHYIGFGGQ